MSILGIFGFLILKIDMFRRGALIARKIRGTDNLQETNKDINDLVIWTAATIQQRGLRQTNRRSKSFGRICRSFRSPAHSA